MSSSEDIYEVSLASSGKLKLRATARLAEGSDEAVFDACVLLHQAARIEHRAIAALSPCPAATRLAASVEECWCLVEGRDPDGAAAVWSRVLAEARDVDRQTSDAMLVRLRPRYDQAIREFVRVVRGCPTLGRLQEARTVVPSSAAERTNALRELHNVLKIFPGVPGLWWLLYRIAEASGDSKQAWEGLTRALALAPENSQYRALSLLVAAELRPRSEAETYLTEARPTLHKASAEICLMYAFAEIELARKDRRGRRERWRRALEAVNAAFPRTRSESLRRNLTAVRLLLEDMQANRRVDRELLYRADLGRLVTAPGANVIDVLRADARGLVGALDFAQDAA